MRSSARSAFPTLLTCLCFAASVFAQSPAKQPVKTPRGSVSGRVTIKDKPAPGVTVGLRKGALENSYDPFERAVTDAEGMYRLTNVPAGNYMVTVAAPAYVPTNSEDRKSVVVGEDENVENINFALVRGGVITGKVMDAEGRPVVVQQVEIYLQAALDRRVGDALPFPMMSVQTDDRGIYRVFGLAPGRYKIGSGRGNDGYGSFSQFQSNYKQAFHPDAADPAKATTIEVTEGSEAKDVDITLGRAAQTFSVSGRIINGETNAAVPNVRFTLQRLLGPRVEYVNTVNSSNARGDFVVEGLIPGKYTPTLFMNEGSDLRGDATAFEIIDGDVSGVTIKLTRGATISGVVIVESENKAAKTRLGEMLMRGYVQPAPGTGFSNGASSQIAADGSFRLAGLPNGAVSISLGGNMGPYPPKGFSILRIEREGMPATRIDVKEAEQVTGVRVYVGYGNASVRGVVKIENGPLASGARIWVRVGRPGESNTFLRPTMVDERGNFLIDGIPPGHYEVTATVVGGGLNKPKTAKQEVTLTDGVVTDVGFTINVTAPDNP